ncbi:MAG: VanZ family protein [Pseudomonadota bacterium]|nr:VanZ family protein [Pseudomonadota bacterium]
MLSVLFFIPVPKALQQSLSAAVLNTGHILFFCLFGFAFFRFTSGLLLYRIVTFLVVVFAISLGVESIQSVVGRAFQWGDIMRNELGALLGLSVYRCFTVCSGRQLSLRLTWLLLVIVAIVIERLPLIHEVMHQHT